MWGEAYKSGFLRAVRMFMPKATNEEIQEFLDKHLWEEPDGSPSYYAVANHCCGGVDAHRFPCSKGVRQ